MKKYSIPQSILKDYKDEAEFIDYNEEDRDLDTIRVYLPKTPSWDKIDNYGLKACDQFYKRPEVPAKLIAIQNEQDRDGNYLMQDEIWDRLNDEQDYYKDELKWIKLQWRRVLDGYWFFNNGKATYMDGWQYFYCGFWPIPTDSGFPDFRDRDRRWFIFARFCQQDPTLFGFIYPKHRREGATSKASCVNYAISMTSIRAKTGIQSLNETSAKDVFQDNIVPAWQNMIFIFKPNTEGSDNPKRQLFFSPPIIKGLKGVKRRSRKSLGTRIDYRSALPKAYDGTKLKFHHSDEAAKTVDVNINERWDTVKLCLSLGAGSKIIGLEIMTSTVGEMEQGGGQNMKELCDASVYSKRSDGSGQTASGLCVLFMPAYDGLENFIDQYGNSVIETPTPEQAKFIGKDYGARQHIEKEIAHKKANSTQDRVMDFMREHPTTFKGCFRTNGRDSFFDIPRIEDQLDVLAEMKTAVVRGDFVWEGYKHRSKVRFVPDPEKGKFKLSKVLNPNESNRISWDSNLETYIAHNEIFTGGGDPFKANETKSTKNSLGGGAVFWGHDPNIDPFDKPMSEWVSNRVVCTYLHRPADKDEYEEDMIMMCIYYGCPMYTETNVQDLKDAFIEKGYRGLLVHKFNKEKEAMETIAGQATDTFTKQQIFKKIQSYIKYHCPRDRHADFLEQVRDITSLQEMTKYDLFTAVGYAMVGQSQYLSDIQMVDKPESNENNAPFFQTFSYKEN